MSQVPNDDEMVEILRSSQLGDPEADHASAEDEILVLLVKLGYAKTAELFQRLQSGWWYA